MSLGLALNVTPTQPQRFWPPFWDGEPGRFVPGRDWPDLREKAVAWQIPAGLRFAGPPSQILDFQPPGTRFGGFPTSAVGLEAFADSRPPRSALALGGFPTSADYRRPGKSLPGPILARPPSCLGWAGLASLACAGTAWPGLGQPGGFTPKWFLAITCSIWLRLKFWRQGLARFFGAHLFGFWCPGPNLGSRGPK